MAQKERRALGRGLGSLIPSGEPNVSRETISPERARDVFFPGDGTDSGERASSAIAADLLKPTPRKKVSKRSSASDRQRTANHRVSDSHTQRKNSAPRSSAGSARSANKNELFEHIVGDGPSPGIPMTSAEDTTQRHLSAGDSGLSESATNLSDDSGSIVSRETIDDVQLIPVPGARFAEIRVDSVIPNLHQPREVFDEEELEELAQSIKEIGILQPVVVRPVNELDERYDSALRAREAEGLTEPPSFELIMGERRLRASRLAGQDYLPAIIRHTDDTHLLRDALLENLHRTQLNPIEEAAAYQQLMTDFDCTQEELSERIARSRSHIANTVRLLNLPGSVQRKLAAGVISAGHARALLSLTSKAQMQVLADRIVAEGLSVRSTEEIVSLGNVTETVASRRGSRRIPARPSDDAMVIIDRLTDLLDTRVTVKEGKRKGRIIVEYAGADDLLRLAHVVRNLRTTPASQNYLNEPTED
ncbi:MAG: ParB/RepB/Spo0J family partition protein [Actinomycetaceae bacterium]|nr:ParB/RepB/Spo0J family partition protein [Actinomycetaceae bacterium]